MKTAESYVLVIVLVLVLAFLFKMRDDCYAKGWVIRYPHWSAECVPK